MTALSARSMSFEAPISVRARRGLVESLCVSDKGPAHIATPALQRRALKRLRERRPGIRLERIEALGRQARAPLDEGH
jgi:hypothetical protein